MTQPRAPQEQPDFSLVAGGPIFQMLVRAHLEGPGLELIYRRVVVITLLAWLPLAVLSAIEGHLYGSQMLSFVRDVESHVRLLVALPVLVYAELEIHRRIAPVLRRFVERRIVAPEEVPALQAAIVAAQRARDSLWLEFALLILVYTAGQWFWRGGIALGGATWYAVPAGTGTHLTMAGDWYGYVSIPIFQFILLRWYLRIVIWFWLLWRISRLNLHLVPTNPDRAGGLGFLGLSNYAFGPILFAEGALLGGVIASRVLYDGQNLLSFKVMIVTVVAFYILMIIGPLVMFTPLLMRTKRQGLGEYGKLAAVYVDDFDKKWIRGDTAEALLGAADIQSLADLANSYAVVREMRPVPFDLLQVTRLALTVAAPILPLMLTIMPLRELVGWLAKIVF
jgi:hypothetical protein